VFHGVGDLASTTIGALGICCKTDHENEPQNASYLYLGTSGWVARCVLGNSLRASGRVLAAGDAERKAGTFTLLHPDPALRIVAASMTTAGGNVVRIGPFPNPGTLFALARLTLSFIFARSGRDALFWIPVVTPSQISTPWQMPRQAEATAFCFCRT
jgi:hypothetical protein